MRKWLNIYFDLSKNEFNGFLVMIVMIFLLSILPYVYRLVRPDLEDIPSEQMALRSLADAGDDSLVVRASRGEVFYFDPNTITSAQWQKLGLSEKQAASILKYRAKGGRFDSATDLAKMYTISADAYRRLAPYVRIAASSSDGGTETVGKETSIPAYLNKNLPVAASVKRQTSLSLPVVEINQADSALLEEIVGIGPVFARRILKYRERLGGFYKKDQLREVYGLDSLKYDEIREQIKVNPLLIKKIDINRATFEILKNFPYLRYKQINAIIQYRNQHGNFASTEDLKQIAIIDGKTIDQLAPYLSF